MSLPSNAVLSALAFAGVLGGIALLRRSKTAKLLIDIPNARSSHTAPTPRGAGAVIVAVTLTSFFALSFRSSDWKTSDVVSFSCGALLVAVVSFIDDLAPLSATTRLGVHICASSILILGTRHLLFDPRGSLYAVGVMGLITCVWVVGMTNAFNFMDGIDGLAGVQTFVAGLSWALLAASASETTTTLAILLMAAAGGFLMHNWPPARIFMGDVGSAYLGFTFAAIPLLTPIQHRLLLGCLIVWPFLFDTTFTIIRRLFRREALLQAHRSHLYQRLVIAGHSHRSVTLLYGALASVGGAAAVLISRQLLSVTLGVAAVSTLALALWVYVLGRETKRLPRSFVR